MIERPDTRTAGIVTSCGIITLHAALPKNANHATLRRSKSPRAHIINVLRLQVAYIVDADSGVLWTHYIVTMNDRTPRYTHRRDCDSLWYHHIPCGLAQKGQPGNTPQKPISARTSYRFRAAASCACGWCGFGCGMNTLYCYYEW